MVRPEIGRSVKSVVSHGTLIGSWMTGASCVVCIKEVQLSYQHDCHCVSLFFKASHLPLLLSRSTYTSLSGPLSFLYHVYSTTQQINLQKLTIYQSLIHSINHPSRFLSPPFTHSIQLLPFTTTIQFLLVQYYNIALHCTSMSFKYSILF